MIEVRFHGRGGQGAVTSAELVALAAIEEGKYAQAFPSFGPERRGAPVMAFLRVDDRYIRVRDEIRKPDVVVVIDPKLFYLVDVTAGLKEGGWLVLNTKKSPEEIAREIKGNWKILTVDATDIALQCLGVPITNTTMIGALVRATEIVRLESVYKQIEHRFGPLAERNIRACERAYCEAKILGG